MNLKAAANRLAAAAMVVAVLLGLASGPGSGVEAAGGSIYSLSITGFCGRITGSAESASVKVKITVQNTGETAMAGYLVAQKSGYNNAHPIGYQDLATNSKATLNPGESVAFVAFATGVNLAGTFRISAGIRPTLSSPDYDYDYTAPYASPGEMPAC